VHVPRREQRGTGAEGGRGRRGLRLGLKALKNHLLYHLTVGLIAVLRLLPLAFVPTLGRLLGSAAFLLARRDRRRALENLRTVHPDLAPRERRLVALGAFRHLGTSALECVALRRLRARLAEDVVFEGDSLDHLRRGLGPGRGVIYATAHVGNFEVMAAAIARHAKVTVLFKPSYDRRFTRLIERFREESGVRGIDVTRAGHLREVLAALGRGEVLGILIDQPPASGLVLPFLGREATTTRLPAALALRTRAPLVCGFIHRRGPCQHAISIRPIDLESAGGDEALLTASLVREVEGAIERDPTQWLWSLKRWRSPESTTLSSHPELMPTSLCKLHTTRR
jgi:Kdo2-lipid IVA lauroyltransferase/acyltransferase